MPGMHALSAPGVEHASRRVLSGRADEPRGHDVRRRLRPERPRSAISYDRARADASAARAQRSRSAAFSCLRRNVADAVGSPRCRAPRRCAADTGVVSSRRPSGAAKAAGRARDQRQRPPPASRDRDDVADEELYCAARKPGRRSRRRHRSSISDRAAAVDTGTVTSATRLRSAAKPCGSTGDTTSSTTPTTAPATAST